MTNRTRNIWASRSVVIVAGMALLVCSVTPQARAVSTATLDFGTPTVTAGAATFDVFLTFPGTPAVDRIEAIGLSPAGSDPVLSRFSFALDTGTLPGWFEAIPINTGSGFYIPADPVFGPFFDAGAGQRRIGELVVDLTGLAPDTAFTVTLAEPGLFQTDVGGLGEGVLVPLFRADPNDTGELIFADPNGVAFKTPAGVIPEPLTMLAVGLSVTGLGGYIRKRRRC